MTAPRARAWPAVLILLAAGCSGNSNDPPSAAPPPPPADLERQIQLVCTHCHAFSPPDTFPRSAWKEEVEQAYRFAAAANMPMVMPPINSVISYFEERAPDKLPPAVFEKSDTPLPVTFRRAGCPRLQEADGTTVANVAVSNVNLVHL